jgi:hypothetical protein
MREVRIPGCSFEAFLSVSFSSQEVLAATSITPSIDDRLQERIILALKELLFFPYQTTSRSHPSFLHIQSQFSQKSYSTTPEKIASVFIISASVLRTPDECVSRSKNERRRGMFSRGKIQSFTPKQNTRKIGNQLQKCVCSNQHPNHHFDGMIFFDTIV